MVFIFLGNVPKVTRNEERKQFSFPHSLLLQEHCLNWNSDFLENVPREHVCGSFPETGILLGVY